MNFENNIKKYIDAVNKKLECYLSPKYPEDIYKAMAASVSVGDDGNVGQLSHYFAPFSAVAG